MERPLLAVTMGDPCGIGPEIICKALAQGNIQHGCTPIVFGDWGAMERALAITNVPLKMRDFRRAHAADLADPSNLILVPCTTLMPEDMEFGAPTSGAGEAVYRYITEALSFVQSGAAEALVTAPINKKALNLAGYHYPGHTELLAELTDTDQVVMMLAGSTLRVTLVTIHEALADVPRLLSIEKVLDTIRITAEGIQHYFKADPKIAVLSLNPHGGEQGLFGSEENLIIVPAIEDAKRLGIKAEGPFPADTLFHSAARGEFDAVVCMYHDQGLIPLKLLHFDDGVNVTLGLPIIRTSVDHGTAYDLAGKGEASAQSLIAALVMAAEMAGKKRSGQ